MTELFPSVSSIKYPFNVNTLVFHGSSMLNSLPVNYYVFASFHTYITAAIYTLSCVIVFFVTTIGSVLDYVDCSFISKYETLTVNDLSAPVSFLL